MEPQIAHLVNSWLTSYDLDFKLEQESLNDEIDKALNEYDSKRGGKGGNRSRIANDGQMARNIYQHNGTGANLAVWPNLDWPSIWALAPMKAPFLT